MFVVFSYRHYFIIQHRCVTHLCWAKLMHQQLGAKKR